MCRLAQDGPVLTPNRHRQGAAAPTARLLLSGSTPCWEMQGRPESRHMKIAAELDALLREAYTQQPGQPSPSFSAEVTSEVRPSTDEFLQLELMARQQARSRELVPSSRRALQPLVPTIRAVNPAWAWRSQTVPTSANALSFRVHTLTLQPPPPAALSRPCTRLLRRAPATRRASGDPAGTPFPSRRAAHPAG